MNDNEKINEADLEQPLADAPVESKDSTDSKDSNELDSKDAVKEITVEQSEIQTVNHQTENVETHAHHLHKVPGHGWKHYFFEFFMLFLAVFCGFFAEYQLEHRIEREREKNYIKSMVADLKKDTSNFRMFIEDGKQAMSMIDSLISLLQSPARNSQTSTMYYLARRITLRITPYEIFDRTYSQMKSSGNLRLLESQYVANIISNYYFDITLLTSQQNYINSFLLEYTKNVSIVFDASIFHQMYLDAGLRMDNSSDARNFPLFILPPKGNPHLANDGKDAIDSLIGTLHYLYARILSTNSNIRNQNEFALQLMKGLQTEYHLE